MTLAERINKTVYNWDPHCYRDSDCSIEYFEDLLKHSPETIINGLLDQIDQMQEQIEDLELEVDDLRR